MSKEQPLLSPSHSHSACPATPTHNQHNATNTQHFTSQQHTTMLYQHTNANTINTADMQNNQFCYDRSSVPLYPSGGEAQDARSLPSGNPVNHQIGGKSLDFLMSCDTSLFYYASPSLPRHNNAPLKKNKRRNHRASQYPSYNPCVFKYDHNQNHYYYQQQQQKF